MMLTTPPAPPELRIADPVPAAIYQEPEQLEPHSVIAEETLIAAIVGSSSSVMDMLINEAHLQPKHFFLLRNERIFEAAIALHKRGLDVDQILLLDELEARKHRDVDTAKYLNRVAFEASEIFNLVAKAKSYARLVIEYAKRRSLITMATELCQMAQDTANAWADIQERAQSVLVGVEAEKVESKVLTSEQAFDRVWQEIEDTYDGKIPPSYSIGIGALDNKLSSNGLEPGSLYTVMGSPGSGKTGMGIEVVRHTVKTGLKSGIRLRALILSYEMKEQENMRRMIAAETGVPADWIKSSKKLSEEQLKKVARSREEISKWPIDFQSPTDGMTIDGLIYQVRREHAKSPLSLLLVDYIGLLETPQFKASDEPKALGYITKNLKRLAMQLNIVVIAIAQVNRTSDGRENKQPTLRDGYGSSGIEKDSDVVLTLLRDVQHNPACANPNILHVSFAKQRRGSTGLVDLNFDAPLNRLSDVPVQVRK